MIEHSDGFMDHADCDSLGGSEGHQPAHGSASSADHPEVAVMEAAVSSALSHPNIVQTYDYQTSGAARSGSDTTDNVSGLACVHDACHSGQASMVDSCQVRERVFVCENRLPCWFQLLLHVCSCVT